MANPDLFELMLKDALLAIEAIYGDEGLAKVARHMKLANQTRENNAEIDALEKVFSSNPAIGTFR